MLPRCTGEILVSFDGDDISEPHRVRRILDAFRSDRRIHAVYSGYSQMDAAGRPRGAVKVPHPAPGEPASRWFARVDANAPGATLAVRREVIERFPPLDPRIAEDLILPFRASLLGEVAFLDEPLVRVRRHAASLTTELERFQSVEKHRVRLERGIEHAARNLESRKADLRVAERLFPDRIPELSALEQTAVESLRAARLTAKLSSPSPAVRLVTFFRLLRAGAYPEHRGRHALLALAPRLNLRYKRQALGISPRRLRGEPVREDRRGPT